MRIISYNLLKEDVIANVLGSDAKVQNINKAFSEIGGIVKNGELKVNDQEYHINFYGEDTMHKMVGTIVQQKDKFTFVFVEKDTNKTYKVRLLNTTIEKLDSDIKYKAKVSLIDRNNKEQELNFRQIEFKDN